MKHILTRLTKHIILLIITNGMIFGQANNQVSKVGTTAANFLQLGVGARALALGDAFTSIADDVSSIYWNPAGISTINGTAAEFYYSPWIADIRFSFTGSVTSLGRLGNLAVGITSVSMDDMPVRTLEYPEGNGEQFAANNLAFSLGYGRRLTQNFAVGMTIKHIQEQIWHMTASSLAADIGVIFQTRNQGIKIGMSISNFGSKMKLAGRDTKLSVDIDEIKAGNNDRIDAYLDTWEWPLPLLFRFGISKNVLDTDFSRLVVAVDAIHPNDNMEYVNLGMEYSLKDAVFLRIGQSTALMENAEQGLSLGAGIKTRLSRSMQLQIDYVTRSFGDLGYISGFSFALKL